MHGFSMMQGRLTPPLDGEQQYFPHDTWRSEFAVAKEIGFSGIEWLVDVGSVRDNPLFVSDDRETVRGLQAESGILITSVDADCFKEGPIDSHSFGGSSFAELFGAVAVAAGEVGAHVIVIPLIEGSSIQSSEEIDRLVPILQGIGDVAADNRVVVALETELGHHLLTDLIDKVAHDSVGACVDLGNLASLGMAPQKELIELGQHVRHVHIKDRALNGGNVPLGTGDVHFAACLEAFSEIGYAGAMTFETIRGDDPVEDARANLRYMNQIVGDRR